MFFFATDTPHAETQRARVIATDIEELLCLLRCEAIVLEKMGADPLPRSMASGQPTVVDGCWVVMENVRVLDATGFAALGVESVSIPDWISV